MKKNKILSNEKIPSCIAVTNVLSKNEQKRFHFRIEKEGKGFWAQCIEFPGCITEANSLNKLQMNIQEALNLYLDEPEVSKEAL